MPVRFAPNGERHEREEYSFYTRDHGSRDFARSRRFGDDDGDEGRTISLVSSPLQVPLIGKRRSVSPTQRRSLPPQRQIRFEDDFDEEDVQEDERNIQQQRIRPAERRRRYEYKEYDTYDDVPLEPLVPTYQPRVGRSGYRSTESRYSSASPRRQPRYQQPKYEEDFEDVEEAHQHKQHNEKQEYHEEKVEDSLPSQKQRQDEELESILNWRKRRQTHQEPIVHTDFGYVMPPMRKRTDPTLQAQDDKLRSALGYVAKRKEFAVEDDEDMQYYRNPNYYYRLHGPERPLVTDKEVEESMERTKLDKAPMFDMKIRSHVVWEKMNVKFTCTVRGSPKPRVTWYKDMVPIEPSLHSAGKYKISNQFGLHTLEINRAAIEDSGTYRVSLQNRKGEISSYATLLVRRYDGGRSGVVDFKSGYNLKKPTDYPDVEGMNIPGYPRFVTPLYGKIVQEGQAMIITCEVEGSPTPEVFWTLNGRTIDENSTHIQQSFNGKLATLTILKVYTDDEGEYCCRTFNSCGAATSRCYVRVRGGDAPPSAPSGVEVSEASRDYVMLSWKAPGYLGHFGGAPIEGYLIETAQAGSSIWKPYNKVPVKLTKTPVTGLTEGKVYFLRVKTVSRWGESPPSLPSAAVAIRDAGSPRLPEELENASTLLPPETNEIFVEEEDEDNVLPGIPAKVSATLSPDGNSVNVSWNAPDVETEWQADGYLIEVCEEGTEEWKTITDQTLRTTDPYPVTGLKAGGSFRFRVFSVNSAGCSEPSECSTIVQVGGAISDKAADDLIADLEQVKGDCRESCENVGRCSDKTQQELQTCLEQNSAEEEYGIERMAAEFEQEKETQKKAMRSKLPSPPVDVKELKATREYITVGWTPPFKTGGVDPVYYVEMKRVGTEEWKICNRSPISLTHFPVSGLEEGQLYVFRVRAVTHQGTSQFSVPSEPILAQDGIKPPNWWGGVQGIFKVADEKGRPCVTKNSVKVCWDAPTTDGGASVLGYYLEYRPAGGKFKPVNNKPLNQRHFTVEGLATGTEYEFRVCACNVAGCGAWKSLPRRVLAKDPEPPTYPTDLLLTAVSEESVSLRWKEPTSMGDSAFVGYIVERCKEGSNVWIPCNRLPEDIIDEKYIVDGLITGQTYFFRVRAVNRVGTGEPSLMSCFVTTAEEWALTEDRQNAMLEMRRKKREEEEAMKRAAEELERKQAFLNGIEEARVNSGAKAYYECTVKDPNTQVKWYLGNNQETTLEPVGKYDIVHVGNRRSLAISNCQHSDIQLVHCVALYNGCSTSAYCIVDGLVPVVFVETPQDVYVSKGETAIFTCSLTRDDAKVNWSKNGVQLSDDDKRFEIISQGNRRSLIIKDAAIHDVASYTVAGFGGSFTSHVVVDGVLPAHFSTEIHGGGYEHDEGVAEIDCVVAPSALYKDGNEPECIWYHNGERVEDGDDKYEIIKKGNKRVLKILDLNHEDSGEIICRCGGAETECDIYVKRPPPPPPKLPVLQAEDSAINFRQGLRSEALPGSIRLYCVVERLREDVKIIWYKDDIAIDTAGKEFQSVIDRESGLVSIVFNQPTPDLADGTYTCEFITDHLTFDTKVNFNFGDGEYKHAVNAAMKLKEDEEREKQQRLEERKKKRAELRKKREEGGKGGKLEPTEKKSLEPDDSRNMTTEGISFEIDRHGDLILKAEVAGMNDDVEVTWLKNSINIGDERFIMETTDEQIQLSIKNLTESDAGTFTCKIKNTDSSTEMSVDITGKVHEELLAKSRRIREMAAPHVATPYEEVDEVQQCSEEIDTIHITNDEELVDYKPERVDINVEDEDEKRAEEADPESDEENSKLETL